MQHHCTNRLKFYFMQKQKPSIAENIYPLSLENVQALFHFYFKKKGIPNGGDFKYIFNQANNLTLIEVEFIAKTVSEHIDFLKSCVNHSGITISNFMRYGVDAYLANFNDGMPSRNKIT